MTKWAEVQLCRLLHNEFRPDPSTFYLVIVVTNKQTDREMDRQTNASDSIIPRFHGDNKTASHYFAQRRISIKAI